MNIIKKTILGFVALSMAFALPFGMAACSKAGGQGGNNGGNGSGYIPDGGSGDSSGSQGGSSGGGNVNDSFSELQPDPDPPATADAVKFIEGAGDLEAAYVKWEAVIGASWYNVYYKSDSGDNWIKLDAPLVRQYKTYFRADAIGLSAGKYSLKVVPVNSTGRELEDKSAIKNVAVAAHERVG